MTIESSKQFVKRYKPKAICVKVWEVDHQCYDWCVVENNSTFVLGSGKSQDSAWNAAALHLRIKLQKAVVS